MLAVGYRENEASTPVPLSTRAFDNSGQLVEIVDDLEITRLSTQESRPVVLASLGCDVKGAILPHPDPGHPLTLAHGAVYRMGRKLKARDSEIIPRFRKFVKHWIKKNLTPLAANSDVSFEKWIEATPYSRARKEELKRVYYESGLKLGSIIPKKFLKCKSFMKDETYDSYKAGRAINSRSDLFKCLVGPIIQLVSDQIFSMEWFIKKVPINERADLLERILGAKGETIFTSDYSSFEAAFSTTIMENCEDLLFEHMTSHLADHRSFVSLMKSAKHLTKNHLNFKHMSMKIMAKRMSGEMDTSLSNGFSNLMFMLFTCYENGNTNVVGFIEGDDGIFRMQGAPPADSKFEDLGLVIKVAKFNELSHASFCGMVFDVDDRTNVTDPIKQLVSFGWTSQRYARSRKGVHMCLLRCKALSLAYQYPSCPIICKLASKITRLTAGYDVGTFLAKQGNASFDEYKLRIIKEAIEYFKTNKLDAEPGIKTRLLVEELYGVSLSSQFAIEAYIENLDEIKQLDCPHISMHTSTHSRDYAERFSFFADYRIADKHPATYHTRALRKPFEPDKFMSPVCLAGYNRMR